MRIAPISNNIAFKGIINIDQKAPKELFKEKKDMFDKLSDAKGVNIICLKDQSGPMVRKADGYVVLLQGDKGSVFKKLVCTGKKESMEKMTDVVEKCLLWYNVPSNYFAATSITQSDLAMQNPALTQQLSYQLYQIAASPEANRWQDKINDFTI